MEQSAYISASRLRGAHHLTASMDGVSFAASTKVGDILYIISEVSTWAHTPCRAGAGSGVIVYTPCWCGPSWRRVGRIVTCRRDLPCAQLLSAATPPVAGAAD